ncbi:MAG: FecR domain-containing protein, partial [Magnetovibrio sp.]|nr:FecR domain-containing protein [Magnetovibrio sp.]
MATNDQGNTILGVTGQSSSTTIEATSGETLVMPDGLNPATADYAHEGPDLVLTWPDGSEVIVKDYFMVDPQPDLASSEGAEVSGDLAARLAGSATPGMEAQAGSDAVAEQPIGQIEKLVGMVTAIRADGTRVELKLGDQVYQGDILETGVDGAIGVILADETTFSMAEDGRMVLDEMVYDPGTQEGSVSLSVMHGVFTFVSGQVAKTDPDAMTLNTPVATIGIRGTQVGLDIRDGQNLEIVLMEEADGFVGEVVVMNNGGVTVLNGANEFTVVTSFNAAPAETTVIDIQQMLSIFSSTLRHLPMSQPNANDFGLQGEIEVGGLAKIEDPEPEGGAESDPEPEPEPEGNAHMLIDFDVAPGEETTEEALFE